VGGLGREEHARPVPVRCGWPGPGGTWCPYDVGGLGREEHAHLVPAACDVCRWWEI